MGLRAWQDEALRRLFASKEKDFLAVATPGAGKTTFALNAATRMLAAALVDQVIVVAPTEHLKRQWADAAGEVGAQLDPAWANGTPLMAQYLGSVVTYAQVSANPGHHRAQVKLMRTLVILDEVHHGGDTLTWGDAIKEAFEPATRRLSLSGSPWRSDAFAIPFVSYSNQGDTLVSRADYQYGYSRALADGVVRPVVFMAYSGQARWRSDDGSTVDSALDAELDQVNAARAWRTALDPRGGWISQVLASADARLSEVRRDVPDAGGLVLASNQTHARAYAKALEALTGEKAAVIVSDEPGSSARIEEFKDSNARWMVAVRMVSEGVDVPRLMVGVYATKSSTELFFTQAVGRFVRARNTSESATLFIPAVPALLELSARIEAERDHVISVAGANGLDDDALAAALADRRVPELSEYTFEALEATGHLDRVIYGGAEYGASVEARDTSEIDLLSMPGHLDAGAVGEILARRAGGASPMVEGQPMYRLVHETRKELAREVALYAMNTGMSHANIHSWLRTTCGGPQVASASLEELQLRIRELRGENRAPEPVPEQAREPEQYLLF